jgi:hypothetical protein
VRLRFYWDFCHKYRHDPLHSDSLPLFLKKLQDKHQSEPQRKQAQQAISLFYEMQTAALRTPVNPKPVSVVSVVTHDPIKGTSSQALTDQSQHKLTVSGFNEVSRDSAASRVVASAAKADSSPAKRTLASHERELLAARHRNEPAGQVAARELEVIRIATALRRADELDGDVAAAIEAAADGSTPSGQPRVIEAPAGV